MQLTGALISSMGWRMKEVEEVEEVEEEGRGGRKEGGQGRGHTGSKKEKQEQKVAYREGVRVWNSALDADGGGVFHCQFAGHSRRSRLFSRAPPTLTRNPINKLDLPGVIGHHRLTPAPYSFDPFTPVPPETRSAPGHRLAWAGPFLRALPNAIYRQNWTLIESTRINNEWTIFSFSCHFLPLFFFLFYFFERERELKKNFK